MKEIEVIEMYIGSQALMKRYDACLLEQGYTIEELVEKASDCLYKHVSGHSFAIVCAPGNNGADGLSLAIKLFQQKKKFMFLSLIMANIFLRLIYIIYNNVMIYLSLFLYFNRII